MGLSPAGLPTPMLSFPCSFWVECMSPVLRGSGPVQEQVARCRGYVWRPSLRVPAGRGPATVAAGRVGGPPLVRPHDPAFRADARGRAASGAGAARSCLSLGLPVVHEARFGPARLGAGATGRIWRAATHPLGAWAIYFAVQWSWHIPSLYQLALTNAGIHALQHVSFLGAAMLFWLAVLNPARGEGRASAFLAVFATAIQSCALAALLTASRTLWYPAYANGAGAWGLSPLEDQQLGGLIMWVPCCAVLIGAAGCRLRAASSRHGGREPKEPPREGAAPASSRSPRIRPGTTRRAL